MQHLQLIIMRKNIGGSFSGRRLELPTLGVPKLQSRM